MLRNEDPVLRSAAFAMLRQLAEHDAPESAVKTTWGGPYREYLVRQLGGEFLNGSFWLHRIAPKSAPLVLFAADTRAEIVLFGDGIGLTAPIRTLAGQEFALTYEAGSDKCVVSRIAAQVGRRQMLCPPTLEDIIRTMAELAPSIPTSSTCSASSMNGNVSTARPASTPRCPRSRRRCWSRRSATARCSATSPARRNARS